MRIGQSYCGDRVPDAVLSSFDRRTTALFRTNSVAATTPKFLSYPRICLEGIAWLSGSKARPADYPGTV